MNGSCLEVVSVVARCSKSTSHVGEVGSPGGSWDTIRRGAAQASLSICPTLIFWAEEARSMEPRQGREEESRGGFERKGKKGVSE